jgi:cyclic-di-AMP phosphodiesterase PgpH
MGMFQKRSKKLKRFRIDRSKPLHEARAIEVAPRGKGAGRLLLTLLFLLSGLVILHFPLPGLRVRVGQIAKKDYRARVFFEAPNPTLTQQARNEAANNTPRVFREDASHLPLIPDNLEVLFAHLQQAEEVADIAAEARAEWGLTRESLDKLRLALKEKRPWAGRLKDSCKAILAGLAEDGILADSDHETEKDSKRPCIRVVSADGRASRLRTVKFIREYPLNVESILREGLIPWPDGMPAALGNSIIDMLVFAAKPTLKRDDNATRKDIKYERDRVREKTIDIPKDSEILARGDIITADAAHKIRLEEEAFARQPSIARDRWGEGRRRDKRLLGAVGLSVVFLSGFGLLAMYGLSFVGQQLASNTRIFGVYVVLILGLAAIRFGEHFALGLYWTPIIFAAMILVVAVGPLLAFGVTFLLAILAGIVSETGVVLTLPILAGGGVAILGLRNLRRRHDPIAVGLWAGLASVLCLWAVHLAKLPGTEGGYRWPLFDSIAAFASAIIGGAAMAACLPLVERFFDIATNPRLLEWTDQNQPLLRKLALEAPGTYHHSSIVGNMAEAAAKSIGANTLLARAGAYLHDIGKLNRPDYFIENSMGTPSCHNGLRPAMSTMIITAHTKDGVELARHYGVPSPLRRIIAEHHGTGIVHYFYNQACKLAKQTGGDVRDDMFRYRGPKPQSPESAIIMIADAVESASRAMRNPTSSRLEKLVHDLVDQRLKDGQLDDCRMSITEIRRIQTSLVRSLMAVSHPRIRYPSL